eukprot:gene2720-1705_t
MCMLVDSTLENCGGDCFTDTPGIETLIHSTRVDDMFAGSCNMFGFANFGLLPLTIYICRIGLLDVVREVVCLLGMHISYLFAEVVSDPSIACVLCNDVLYYLARIAELTCLMHVVMGLWLVIELAALFDLVDFGFVCCLGISILLDLMLLSLDLFFMLLQRELSFVYLVCVRLGFVLGFMVLQIDIAGCFDMVCYVGCLHVVRRNLQLVVVDLPVVSWVQVVADECLRWLFVVLFDISGLFDGFAANATWGLRVFVTFVGCLDVLSGAAVMFCRCDLILYLYCGVWTDIMLVCAYTYLLNNAVCSCISLWVCELSYFCEFVGIFYADLEGTGVCFTYLVELHVLTGYSRLLLTR